MLKKRTKGLTIKWLGHIVDHAVETVAQRVKFLQLRVNTGIAFMLFPGPGNVLEDVIEVFFLANVTVLLLEIRLAVAIRWRCFW